MADSIRLAGIEAHGRHGVYEAEKREGQAFVVDVTLHADLARAATSDDIAHTVDYGTLAEKVHHLVGSTRFDLIEGLAAAIAEEVLSHDLVSEVEVTVHKPAAPIPVPISDVSVTVRRP